MAHIDAGKTTTSERMLYYAGYIKQVGEVHHGDTVMDYMDQERDRGITISSAAITYPWLRHRVNLIDTPGHVDFTMEVERSLRVLDGSVLLLDGSAGVQAQTVTVWRQARRNRVPCIAFVNKMDKPGADLEMTTRSIRRKLGVTPLVTQLPIGNGRGFTGVVDLVKMEALVWTAGDESCGKSFVRMSEDDSASSLGDTWLLAGEAREHLVESAADLDDRLAELVIGEEPVGPEKLDEALRRISLNCDSGALVTLLGSSYKNTGVQPLMDAMIKYLPSPEDRRHEFAKFYGNNFCGLVFKILHHPQKGVLSFVRVYCGSVKSSDSVFNVNRSKSEKIGKLLVAFADDFHEVGEVGDGNIAVISGLKLATTGDTLVHSGSVAREAEKKARGAKSLDNDDAVEEGSSSAVLAGPLVPEPVFFCSVEPPSLAAQKQFDLALAALAREDPSLRVTVNSETGQTVLGGMGELHLSIVRERILTGWKVDVELGQLQVAYREMLSGQAREEVKFERKVADRSHSVVLDISVEPLGSGEKSRVEVSRSREAQETLAGLRPTTVRTVVRGLTEGMDAGPLLGFPVLDCRLTLHRLEVGRGTSSTMLVAGAVSAARSVLRLAGVRLAEPVMSLELTADARDVAAIGQDIVRRRGEVGQATVSSGSELQVVTGFAPLSELRGYSTQVRTLTSGRASIAMELSHYQIMSEYEQNRAIEEVTGFAPPS